MEDLVPARHTRGPHDDVTDVGGVTVGHCTMTGAGELTGVTVLVPPPGTVGGVDVRGAAPGTRETDLLDPINLVDAVDAILLAGGSAYGLAAADGVMAALEAEGRGWPVAGGVVPIVPGAVIFDLGRGGDLRARPGAAAGRTAYAARTRGPVPLGSVGAGTGAVAGGVRGGLGSASTVLPSGATVAALVVVNSAGSVVDPVTGRLYSPVHADGQWRASEQALAAYRAIRERRRAALEVGTTTTLGIVVTDYTLTKAQCAKAAGIAHDGLARAVDPVHTMFDGDTMFALATGSREAPSPVEAFDLLEAAAGCLSRAIGAAVLAAAPGGPAPTYVELFRD